jgi:hypothetical protein
MAQSWRRTRSSWLGERVSRPVIAGHELFDEPNVLQRGAGTLLNARLIPVIGEFLQSVKEALSVRGIHAPVVIVRSDGTLMSESFTGVRPVETLLCGPAASVMGGMALADAPDCLIVDMGGTTTDMAVVRNGVPLKARDGVRIGKWKTYVKGVYIDTFGLGGDSEIRQTQHGVLHLDSARVVPLCMAAARWPSVVPRLSRLVSEKSRHTLPLHTFFVLVKDAARQTHSFDRYTPAERAFCSALADGPLIWTDAAAAIGVDPYNLDMKRLEREGVVIRSGLTPTDLMHVRGEFTRYDRDASQLGLQFVARSCDMAPEEMIAAVYNRIQKTMYVRLVRLLLEESDPWYRSHGLGQGLERLIEARWDALQANDAGPEPMRQPGNPLLEWQKATGANRTRHRRQPRNSWISGSAPRQSLWPSARRPICSCRAWRPPWAPPVSRLPTRASPTRWGPSSAILPPRQPWRAGWRADQEALPDTVCADLRRVPSSRIAIRRWPVPARRHRRRPWRRHGGEVLWAN